MPCLRRFKSLALTMAGLAVPGLVSCKSSEPPKNADQRPFPSGSGATGDTVQCSSASNCQPGSPQLLVNGMISPRLVGDVNQQISWQISARSSMYPGRAYAAMSLTFSPSLPRLTVRQPTTTLSGSDTISVEGRLTTADAQASSTARIVVRDMTACKVVSGANSQACNNISPATQFDSTLTASVSFSSNNYTPYGPNAVIPNGTNNNTGPDLGTRIGIAAGLGGLQALLGGDPSLTGILGGVVNGAVGSLNSGSNNYSGGTGNMYNGNGFYNQNSYQPNNQQNGYQQNNYIRGY
ncbi:MAG: hypothetical protein RIQ81_419 [Pseudomonadota bacterium]|jgi:hypothetical protein